MMKIALIGNMNNNGLALLRYFSDLGHETHLYLYQNDGTINAKHFHWKNDTWYPERLNSKIVRTPLLNNHLQVINNNFFINFFLKLLYKSAKLLKVQGYNWLNPGLVKPGQYIDKTFKNYDLIYGCGNTPALFLHSNVTLNVFYPYSTGIEYFRSTSSTTDLIKKTRFKFLLKGLIRRIAKMQKNGILQTEYVYNAELGLTKKVLEKIQKEFKILPIPLVYREKEPRKFSHRLNDLIVTIQSVEFSIIMTSRQFWSKDLIDTKPLDSKNNHWLILAFARFIKTHPKLNTRLFLLEYGKDVNATKELINEHQLQDKISWIPILKRKEILILLKSVSVSVGEFYVTPKTIWGGTGLEALSTGTPFINSLQFDPQYFFKNFGYPLPPILNANSVEEIEFFLNKICFNKQFSKNTREESKKWFDKNGGLELAKKWII